VNGFWWDEADKRGLAAHGWSKEKGFNECS